VYYYGYVVRRLFVSTFSFVGFRIGVDQSGIATSIAGSVFATVYEDGDTPSETYSIVANTAGNLPTITFNGTNRTDLSLDGVSVNNNEFLSGANDAFFIGEMAWDDGGTARSTTVLRIWDHEASASYLFALGGDALPAFATANAFQNWLDSDVTGFAQAPVPHAPTTSIDFSASPFATSTEDDVINGTDEADIINAGVGDDTVFGNGGDDIISGGDGADALHGGEGRDIASYADETGTVGAGKPTDYFGNPASVYADLSTGTALDTWGNTDTLTGIEGLIGTDGFDWFVGDGNDNYFVGHDFYDFFHGGGGSDTVSYAEEVGAGGIVGTLNSFSAALADRFTDTHGNEDFLYEIENIIGSRNDDNISGSGGDNVIYLGDGDDYAWGRAGDDIVNGGAGFDIIKGASGNDVLDGGGTHAEDELTYDGTHAIIADFASGTVIEINPFDAATVDQISNFLRIRGTNSRDTLRGDEHDNEFVGGRLGDTIDGRGGDGDRIRYDLETGGISRGLVADMAAGTVLFDGWTDNISNIEIIDGTVLGDTFNGDENANTFFGHFGPDILNGGGGDDWLHPGEGDDTVDGGDGYDVWSYEFAWNAGGQNALNIDLFSGTITDAFGSTDVVTNVEGFVGTRLADTMLGDGGQNSFYGLQGDDVFDGRGGIYDSIKYDRDVLHGGNNGVIVNLANGIATDGFGDTDTFSNIEDVFGTAFADQITGDSADNWLEGRDGDDLLNGGGGEADYLIGGFGNDHLIGGGAEYVYYRPGQGTDTVEGGVGWDRVSFYENDADGGSAGVIVDLSLGTATDGFGDTDTLISVDGVVGTRFADTLIAGPTDNTLEGWGGNDTLLGGAGRDILLGHSGDDLIDASAGPAVAGQLGDFVNPGTGRDTVRGHVDLYLLYGTGIFLTFEEMSVVSGVEIITGTDGSGTARSIAGTEIDTTFTYATTFGGTNTNDTFHGSGHEKEFWMGFQGNDAIDGGAGIDRVRYDLDVNIGATVGITADLNLGIVTDSFGDTDTLTSIEEVLATRFDDVLQGSAANEWFGDGQGTDIVRAGGGDDVLYNGGGSADLFDGGVGEDWFITELANFTPDPDIGLIDLQRGLHGSLNMNPAEFDVLIGIENAEWIGGINDPVMMIGSHVDNHLIAGAADDTLSGGSGDDALEGKGGDDRLTDTFGDDTLDGGDGDDTLVVLTGTNTLDGGAMSDVILGGTGSDTLIGGAGNDLVVGDTSANFFGNDRLEGGAGDDLLEGGRGADVFVFAPNEGSDTIADFDIDPNNPLTSTAMGRDFSLSLDRLDLSAFGYGDITAAVDQFSDIDGHATFADQGTEFTLFGLLSAELNDDIFILV
jgi:Ca2+-binding RTX toxin-like protein